MAWRALSRISRSISPHFSNAGGSGGVTGAVRFRIYTMRAQPATPVAGLDGVCPALRPASHRAGTHAICSGDASRSKWPRLAHIGTGLASPTPDSERKSASAHIGGFTLSCWCAWLHGLVAGVGSLTVARMNCFFGPISSLSSRRKSGDRSDDNAGNCTAGSRQADCD